MHDSNIVQKDSRVNVAKQYCHDGVSRHAMTCSACQW